MTSAQKKLLSNLLFAGGLALAILGVVLTAAGGNIAVLAIGILALGIIAALGGIVIGFIPARRS